jgi:DNA-binding NarL/FixJ family response regulator
VRRIRAPTPDVVVTDLTMPGLDGASACEAITTANPDIGVLALTMHSDGETVVAALRAGARGYVLKGADRREMVRAIEAVAAGQAFCGAAIAGRIATPVGLPANVATASLPNFTPREREVLSLLAHGARNGSAVGEWGYYVIGSAIEVCLLAGIAYYAWTWPRQSQDAQASNY